MPITFRKTPNVSSALEEARARNYAWVFYRMPHSSSINFVCGEANPLGEETEGFWIAPYKGNAIRIAPVYATTVKEEMLRGLSFSSPNQDHQLPETTDDEYITSVLNAMTDIAEKRLEKVVLSAVKKVTLAEEFNPFDLFDKLTHHYPDAFVYLAFTPQFGAWIGSSPELLVELNGDAVRTMALAGTQPDAKKFTEKEKREQELVSRFIEDKLRLVCDKVSLGKLSSKKAGQLYHLSTEIRGRRKIDTSLKAIANVLHPTPAVCGLPPESAAAFIAKTERHERLLYSGYLGPVMGEDSGSLFVNLRCMHFSGREAILYAGAGIVEGSDPQAEWLETRQKMDTLLRVISGDGR